MAEDIQVISGSKQEQYESLLPQIRALICEEPDLTANLANISASLKEQFKWLWVGFYLVKNEDLVLGPFQGPVACTRIGKGRGVCGTSWMQNKTIIVPDISLFAGHISCSSRSVSEIVVPLVFNNEVRGVLDADSEYASYFDDTDRQYLEEIAGWIDFRNS